jgi:FtsH-binding integral membrane protein
VGERFINARFNGGNLLQFAAALIDDSHLRRFGEGSVAIGNTAVAARVQEEASTTKQLKTFLSRYFYFCMSLVMAGLVVWGFRRTVDPNLFHANPPRPLLLWMHGAAFSTWLVFFTLQSALVRGRRVSVHRFLGWFGAGLATAMVVLGFTIAVVMARFDTFVLHQKGAGAFLSVPFCDMIIFGACIALAIYWRKRPEYHRRLIFIATCGLVDAAIGRFDFWFDHNLFYPAVDFLIVLGMARDWTVDGRIHRVYVYALAPLVIAQSLAVYMWRVNPEWQGITHAILG